MTQQEFIIHYALHNKEMPPASLLEQMQKADMFTDVTEKTEHIDIYRGCTIVCKQPMRFNKYITLPKGFVCKVANMSELDDGEIFLLIAIQVKKNVVCIRKTHSYMTSHEINTMFKVMDITTPLSVINDIVYNPCSSKTHKYMADETTLQPPE